MQTITEPTADQQQERMYNTRMKRSESVVLELDTKYAVCLLKLAPGVTQPDDYPTLKAAVEAVVGIQEVTLLIDTHGTPAEIPEGKELRMVAEAHLRIDNAPEE